MAVEFDTKGFRFDGRDEFMLSGEFHYFRVPREDWERRMRLFKEAGGNMLATYVPWLIHEPEEGHIVFGDRGERDLRGFLDTCARVGLKVMLRPGPYQYSELACAGLPRWLIDNYPEILARDINGKVFNPFGVSYLHPVFLEKARVYFRAFAEQVKPYLASNGGPVVMLQADNELTGVHIWYGSLDYNPVTMGIGLEDGRYARFLRDKYGDIASVNKAYGTDWKCFSDARPQNESARDIRVRDYTDFYHGMAAEYISLLCDWMREDGLEGPFCHNAANPGMNALFRRTADAMSKGFLLGSDHYYNLDQDWPQNSPTPQYAVNVLMSCDVLSAMGMPPTVMELPGGSPSDTPPILREDLLACYMTNLASGAKGVNIYVYTGGPNFPGTGDTCDIYDYNALVRADGSQNVTFGALRDMGTFMDSHRWMQRAERAASVQVGFTYDMLTGGFRAEGALFDEDDARVFMRKGILHTLMCSRFSPKAVSLEGDIDQSMPLIVPCASAMSEEAQRAVVAFMQKGGSVLIAPVLPDTDLSGNVCRVLADALGICIKPAAGSGPVNADGTGNVYGLTRRCAIERMPEDAVILARDALTGEAAAIEVKCGAGRCVLLTTSWKMTTFPQAAMMENVLSRFGAREHVRTSNRNIFPVLWRGAEGEKTLFLMNLYSGAQTTRFAVDGGEYGEEIPLAPMEVRVIEIH